MQVVPVLDLLGGHAVHAVAGKRDTYAPVQSRLTPSSTPVDLARALRSGFELDRIYMADLDSLQHAADPSLSVYRELAADGFSLLVDAGVRCRKRALELVDSGVSEVIVALETLKSPGEIGEVLAAVGPNRTVFSVDLQGGQLLGGPVEWRSLQPIDLIDRVIRCGVTRLLLLDLAAVGTSEGWPLGPLTEEARQAHGPVRIISGGGVRDPKDLVTLRDAGVDDALVATALHTGRISVEDVHRITPPEPTPEN